MGARSSAREAALQMLFALDASDHSAGKVIASFWRLTPGDAEGRPYADELVREIAGALEQIDEAIRGASKNWRLERMTRVDRNILRIGTYEIQKGEVPTAVAIDEAVELAKRYGTEESGAFINGILDALAATSRA